MALAALTMLAASGPGVRFEAFDYRTGLQMFIWSGYAGIAAALLAVVVLSVGRLRARGIALPVMALLVGLAVTSAPLQLRQKARAVPPINDITTDGVNPPKYMTASRAYPGEDFARQQRAAYPDIVPLVLYVPPAEAFSRALTAAEAMSWEVVGRDAKAGTLEAIDTTKWFGFKDDIAVRITPTENGSRVDVRSKSRVGRSDIGTNAQRIRAYLARLK